jgi:SAM-dependent methyltransferase
MYWQSNKDLAIRNLNLMRCPICNNIGKAVQGLSKDYILIKLIDYYAQIISTDLNISNYHLLRCQKCGLEYCSPMLPGGEAFYQWITSQDGYYPTTRWEWFVTIDRIKNSQPSTDISILEIGCGSGSFLELAKKISSGDVVGLDTTLSSVENCLEKGLIVYCESVEVFLRSTNKRQYSFDYVVAFHCLEHVSEPKDLVVSMLKLLKSDGKIYLSTPYSPMSFEGIWFDPLNYPPHHLTRWNERAYEVLAQQLDLHVNFIMPTASDILFRMLYALHLAWKGPSAPFSPKRVLLAALVNPLEAAKEFVRQSKRMKVGGKVAADVILVELSRKSNGMLGVGQK